MNALRLGAFFVALVPALALIPACGTAQTIQVSSSNRTIDITATDKVIVMADVATVHIGFSTYGATKDAAYAAGSALSNGIVKALTSAGVAADTIESENQSIAPVQPFEEQNLSPEEKAQRKFRVVQTWMVRASAEAAARVLDVAVKAGANQSGQIEWSLRDENAADADAGAKALQQARASAARIAQSLNAKLGALLYASNQVEESPVRPMLRTLAAPSAVMAETVQVLSINPRRIERSATVHAVFALD